MGQKDQRYFDQSAIQWSTLDEEVWESIEDAEGINRLSSLANQILNVNSFGHLVKDLFGMLFQLGPEFKSALNLASTRKNKVILEKVKESISYLEMHEQSSFDPVLSAIGTVDIAEELLNAMKSNSQLQDWYNEKSDEGKGQPQPFPGEGDEDGQEQSQSTMGDADAAAQLAVILQPILAKAAEEIDKADELLSAFGYGKDSAILKRTKDASKILEIAERLRKNRKLKNIAEMTGRLKRITSKKKEERYTNVPEEVYDVSLGSDYSRLVASEVANLAIPELEDELLSRILGGKALCYELRGRERLGKGPIVFTFDHSGSMHGHRDEWATSVALVIYSIAKAEKRTFHVMMFNTRVQWEFTFNEANNWDESKMLEMAEMNCGGGTSFEVPLSYSLKKIIEDTTPNGKGGLGKADILFVTDGDCRVSDSWVKKFTETREERDITVNTVLVNATPIGKQDVGQISDAVFEINDIVDASREDDFIGDRMALI